MGIQLVPTGKRKANGQHKYYSIRLNQRNQKKRSVPPKTFSQNKGRAKESHRCNTTSPKESFNQESLASGTHTRAASSRLPACLFLKVRRQEVYSWPDEKAIHTLNGSPGRIHISIASSSSSHKSRSKYSPGAILLDLAVSTIAFRLTTLKPKSADICPLGSPPDTSILKCPNSYIYPPPACLHQGIADTQVRNLEVIFLTSSLLHHPFHFSTSHLFVPIQVLLITSTKHFSPSWLALPQFRHHHLSPALL